MYSSETAELSLRDYGGQLCLLTHCSIPSGVTGKQRPAVPLVVTCLKSRGPVAPPVGATQRAFSSSGAGGPRSHIRQAAYQCVSKGCCCSDAAWFALRWEGLLSRAGTLYQCWSSRRSRFPSSRGSTGGCDYRCSSATFLAYGGPGADGASRQAATSPRREPRSRSRIRAAASSRSTAVIAVVLRSASLAPPPPPLPSLPSALAPPLRASPARRSMRSSCH